MEEKIKPVIKWFLKPLVIIWSMAGWIVMGLWGEKKEGCKKEECCYYDSYRRMVKKIYYCRKYCCGIKKAEVKCTEDKQKGGGRQG